MGAGLPGRNRAAADNGSSRISGEKLGTFLGVFTPSILTILGVILYLRTGWLVGSTSLLAALAIIVVANLITLATALSVSSIATNMHVGAGGAYYIISRSLGIEIGGAIGIPLFLAQTFSVTLYAFGLAESLQLVWPDVPVRTVAVLVVLAVTLTAARSARLALKLQIPIMIAIGVSLAVLCAGALLRGPAPAAAPAAARVEFWTAFAVFFPAVTGIMAGVAMSGDLERPRRSIPLGTISAVVVGFGVYLAIPFVLAYAASPGELASNNLIWFDIAGAFGMLILPGLWGAIYSSAVGSILGAPRTLQALVHDRVVPQILGRDAASPRAARFALAGSAAVALAAVGLGTLDAVAPVLTMFFLTTYGMVNLVAGLEQLSRDPSFRPTLRVPWYVSLVGAAACFWVMFLISWWACLLALLIEIGLWTLMRRRAMPASWGDVRRGALLSLVRHTVLRLRHLPHDPRSWRPHVLLFAGDVERRLALVRFAAWINQDRGILTVCELIVGRLRDHAPSLSDRTDQLNDRLERMGITAFGEVDVVPDFESGTVAVAQANGIAGIASNIVMLGWSDKRHRTVSALRIINELARLGKSSVICRPDSASPSGEYRRIDVWWGGLQNNGDLLLLLAHLLSLNADWRHAQIRIKSIATNPMMLERTRDALDGMIRAVRISAHPSVIVKPAGVNVLELIHEQSADADVVLMGLRATDDGQEEDYALRLAELVEGLPAVLLVRNAGRFAGELLHPPEAARVP